MLRTMFRHMKSKVSVRKSRSGKTEQTSKQQKAVVAGQARKNNPAGDIQPLTATEQTLELLRQVEPEDILELMFPRLIIEQERQLAGTDRELARIDKRLSELYHRREDILKVRSQPQGSGVAVFND